PTTQARARRRRPSPRPIAEVLGRFDPGARGAWGPWRPGAPGVGAGLRRIECGVRLRSTTVGRRRLVAGPTRRSLEWRYPERWRQGGATTRTRAGPPHDGSA